MYKFISDLAIILFIIFVKYNINCLSKQQLLLKKPLQSYLLMNINQDKVNTA